MASNGPELLERGLTTPAAALVTGESSDQRTDLAIRWLFPDYQRPVVLLVAPSTVFGRDPTCRGFIPGTDVSRRHAEVVREGPLYVVQDLGSRNGVFLNGRQVEQAALSKGDVIRLGEWVGLVILGEPDSGVDEPPFRPVDPDLLVGPGLAPIIEEARQVAPTPIAVILQGETGTGKERIARAIHAWSGRAGPFVAINCAALPENLAEGELFGHRRGAFTGADRAREGHLRAAHGGTLFLDEIVELPLGVQAKLLRAVERREVLPLGESSPIPADIRLVTAAQSPLEQAVEAKRFRSDLYARLDGVTLRIPPLRERPQEIAFLFLEFLRRAAPAQTPQVSPRLIEQLCLYEWPHNVRELDLLVTRLLATKGGGSILRRSHLPERILRASRKAITDASTEEPEGKGASPDARTVAAALNIFGGNVSRAARALGISRQKAYRLVKPRPDEP
jgi:sigma-54 dependent transcriptional regulator, acetoin dehydrogenase operon transcriptional activator AcoR